MAIQVLYLQEDDDIVSIRDRLDWAKESQLVLVCPPDGDVLTSYLDLAMLRRHADSLRLEVGLISTDHRINSQAKALGFPVFSTVRAATRSRRRWWRGKRRRELVGQRVIVDESDQLEIRRRRKEPPTWRKWLTRYLAIILYIVILALIFITAVYAIPGATITLRPDIRPVAVSRQIVVDPQLAADASTGATVPGRVLSSIQEWQAEVETTGTVAVADSSSRGTVIFVNKLDEPVTVPAGTRVSTSQSDRIVFQTISPVEVPDLVGGTVEAQIEAIEPGEDSNVAIGLINRLQGTLANQLEVRNLESTTGGLMRQEPAVTEADQQRLRSQVLQQLQVRALAEMESMLTDNEVLARDSLRLVDIFDESYTHFPGEQASDLTVEIRAELQATAVNESQAVALVYEGLADEVTPGFELVPDSLIFGGGEVIGVDGQGRVTFEMMGEGLISARLVMDDIIEPLSGQEIGQAASFLYEQLPLSDYPTIRVWPEWFGRLPYLPVRIRTHVETGAGETTELSQTLEPFS
jgi:hypothetical protein